MSITHHHFTAALTPEGRITPLAFFALFVPLMVAEFVLFRLVSAVPVEQRGLSAETAVLLVIVYMQYCLLSRRRQDKDKSGLPYLAFLIVGAACWYKLLDPSFLELDLPPTSRFALPAAHIQHAARILAAVFFIIELAKPGVSGPNQYGQEFGESSGRVSRWRTEAVMSGIDSAPRPPRAADGASKVPPVVVQAPRRRSQQPPIPDARAGFGRLGRPAAANTHGH